MTEKEDRMKRQVDSNTTLRCVLLVTALLPMAACDLEASDATQAGGSGEVSQSLWTPLTTLRVVNVGAPAINCVFSTSCTTSGIDTTGNIPLPGISGTAFLQTRTIVGGTGAPAQGLTDYEYRVDLTQAVGILALPCVTAVRVDFGPVASLQYDGAGPTDQVFVITAGGSGTIGLSSATEAGDEVTFNFASPVCAGSSPGTGASSFFFGLSSTRAPTAVNAVVSQTTGGALSVAARAPNLDKCTAGGAFTSADDACTSSVCTADPFCCNVAWDSICVGEVRTVCNSLTCAEAEGTCTHPLCTAGSSLVNSCDSTKANCAAAICAVDSFCCTTAWDNFCVNEVDTVCGKNCE